MFNRPRHYILGGDDGETVIPVTLEEWIAYFAVHEFRRVRQSVYGDVTVSTIFTGLDHNYSDEGDPLVFETMVFGGALDQHMDRYHTFYEAVLGHVTVCELVEAAIASGHPN